MDLVPGGEQRNHTPYNRLYAKLFLCWQGSDLDPIKRLESQEHPGHLNAQIIESRQKLNPEESDRPRYKIEIYRGAPEDRDAFLGVEAELLLPYVGPLVQPYETAQARYTLFGEGRVSRRIEVIVPPHITRSDQPSVVSNIVLLEPTDYELRHEEDLTDSHVEALISKLDSYF